MAALNNITPETYVSDLKTIINHFKAKRDIRLKEFIELIVTPDHISYSHYYNYLTEISVLMTFLISKTEDISISIPLNQFAASDLITSYEQVTKIHLQKHNEIKSHLAQFEAIFKPEVLDHFNQSYLLNIWTKYVFRQVDIEADQMELAELLGIC
ncbi:MAG: hypothetical protein HOD92_16475 [Deltaproteobacteria bacterium]|jgi:hypothetical protein|nr:hypothetical protein [Deltaproteobacteria bacterium]MBT4525887.1 hypothetical protein [Deltaproteobacteria bacterium]